MIIECIRKVKEIGFHIVAVVSDMGSNFVQLTKSLEVNMENSSFEIDGETYFYIFDVPHLLKATRNNLMNNVFSINDKLTSWKHVEAVYEIGKTMRNHPAPKLTENHIRPNNFARMKVKFATQVISMTVATSIELMVTLKALEEDALVTSDFIRNFDNLFDMCNSSTVISSKEHKKAFTGSDFQLNFLNKMMTMISTLKVYKQLNDGLKDLTNSLSFKNGWIITIRSIQEIWKKLKNVGFDFLLTRRLNQDCLENFFGAIRSLNGNALNPTPLQFLNSFKKLFFINYSNLGNTGNCLDDYDTILTNFSNIESVIIPTISFFDNQNQSNFLQKVLFNDIQETEISKITEENVFIFVCGYLLKKCLKIHYCDICDDYSKSGALLNRNTIYSYYRVSQDNPFDNLCMAPNEFIIYVKDLENLFFENFYDLLPRINVIRSYVQLFKQVHFKHPCNNFPYIYLITLFARVRLFYTLKFINRHFQEQKGHAKYIILNHN